MMMLLDILPYIYTWHFIWDLTISTGLCVADNDRGKIQTILPLIVCLLLPLPLSSLVVNICQGSISGSR